MAVPPVFVAGAVLTAAQMNQIGLWRTKAQTSFSAASSVVADNVFTSDFESYCVIVRYTTTSTTGIAFQLRVGGVTAATNSTTLWCARYSDPSSMPRRSSAVARFCFAGCRGSKR